MLELFTTHLGRLLKIDKHRSNKTREKFVKICVEIDLSQPLKQGFGWRHKGERLRWKYFMRITAILLPLRVH